jgi:hypothetical protein
MTPSTTADELDQNAVPHQLHHAPPVGRDCRIDHVAAMLLHGTKSPRLVRFHEAAIPDHIGHKDGCKPAMEALLGHVGLRWMPSDAVNCATEIQQQTAEGNAGLAPDRRIELRIGINLGDVIVEGEDIYATASMLPCGYKAWPNPAVPIGLGVRCYRQLAGDTSRSSR